MFGFVKNWFGKSGAPLEESPVPGNSVANNPLPADPDSLLLPLTLVLAKLPADLRERVRVPSHSQLQMRLPLTLVLPQLARGAVKLSFADLRRLSPSGVFFAETDKDNFMVELPLAEILSRLKPEHLPRRGQTATQVSPEVVSPFAGRGEGLNIYKPASPVAEPLGAKRRDDEEPLIPFSGREQLQSLSASAPISAPLPSSAAAPAPVGLRLEMLPSTSATSVRVQAAAQPPNPSGATLKLPLAELSDAWLPAVRSELAHFGLVDATLAVPITAVEDGLKKGRMIFTWKQIRSWTDSPAATMNSSAHDAELLELPLKSVAPAFLALARGARGRALVNVDETIPDTFAGPARSTQPKLTEVTGRGGASVSAPAGNAEPAADDRLVFPDEHFGKARIAESPRAADMPSSGTEFLRRYATPNDIVNKAVSFDGVVGALVTLPDGLLVASHLPHGVNGDQLAAFMPQIFGRMTQSAREFRMGELRDLQFTVGVTPWKMFRVGAIYFGVFGREGEPLPITKLTELAAELDRKPRA